MKKGLKCVIANGWGDDRDDLIGQSKILVNVHFYDEFKVYESIRCDRWVMNKTMVVSETSLVPDDPVIKYVIFVPYSRLVRKIVRLISNYDKAHANLFKNFDLKEIRKAKRKKLDQFVSYYNQFATRNPKN